MKLPYVVDNREHTLANVLNALLRDDPVRALDVATAYFNVGAFDLLREGLERLASFRLLLGAEPGGGEDLGLRQRICIWSVGSMCGRDGVCWREASSDPVAAATCVGLAIWERTMTEFAFEAAAPVNPEYDARP